jgi:hypothetical protein
VLLPAPSPAFAQDKHGTVNVDSLAVYARMSTDSDVVKTLAKGTVVRILLTVAGEEGNWCSIASLEGSARAGYVLSSGLNRPREIPVVEARGRALPPIEILNSSAPAHASGRQTRESRKEAGFTGQTLADLPGYSWSSNAKTLVLALRTSCSYCHASLPFYKQLGDLERSNALHAHILAVMPADASVGSSFLAKDDVEVQAIFSQKLDVFKVSGTPTVLLVDSGGRVERTWVGQLTPQLEKEVIRAAEK